MVLPWILLFTVNVECDVEGDDTNPDMPSTECISVYLIQLYLNADQILCTYKFYTSPLLDKHLLNNNKLSYGAIQTNRKYCYSSLVNFNLEKMLRTFF